METETLVTAGSLSTDSRSIEVARYTAEQLGGTLFDPREHDLQFCDARDWAAYNEDTTAWQDAVAAADQYLFVVPVYNWSMSGVFKNMLDLIPPDTDTGDRAGVIGVGHNEKGFLMTQREVTSALEYFSIQRVSPAVFLQHGDWEDGQLRTGAQDRVDELLDVLRD